MAYEFLQLDRQGKTATLTLARPKVGNALSIQLMQEIIAAANSLKHDMESRVVILKGAGKNFCVGADLRDAERTKQFEDTDILRRVRGTAPGRELIESILNINQITIAAVQGAAAGGGACIASACDFRIGSDDCKIGYPEVKLGMNLSWGALPLCYNLIGPAKTRRMVIGGEFEPASELQQWGFLDDVVPLGQLDNSAASMAAQYAEKPALAAQMIKHSINALQLSRSKEVMHMDGGQFTLATMSGEFKEARKAFLNRFNS